jgi:hypothetical protein
MRINMKTQSLDFYVVYVLVEKYGYRLTLTQPITLMLGLVDK